MRIVLEKAQPADSIDERVLPSLVANTMSGQQPLVFKDFVWCCFPRFFGLNRNRLKVTWAGYVQEQLGRNKALDAAIYCITCAFMGQYHDDLRLRQSSHEMYSKAMGYLLGSIKDVATMKSRESVSTSILLSLFEVFAATKEDSWAQHAGGTALMMSLRGANAHRSGFDRCLYMSFRSFLVAQALVECKPCIFEKPEWQSFMDRIRREDVNDTKSDEPVSVFIDISDRLFMEIAKFPGIVSETQDVLSPSTGHPSKKKLLAARIWNCRRTTRALATEMRIALSVHGYLSRLDKGKSGFVGPIATTFPEGFANCLLRGTDTTISILDLLLAELAASEIADLSEPRGSTPVILPRLKDTLFLPASRRFRIVTGLQGNKGQPGGSRPEAIEWMDLVASSMGMEGLKLVYDAPTTLSRR
jgi:hypothetical protein